MDSKSTQQSRRETEVPYNAVAQAEAIASSSTMDSTADEMDHSGRGESRIGASMGGLMGQALDTDIENTPPPPYSKSEAYGIVDMSQDGLNTRANIDDDGRININIDQRSRKLSNLIVPALRNQLKVQNVEEPSTLPPGYIPPALEGKSGKLPPPPLNVVIHVVGSRGDVQPFVALGKVLKERYGHRMRLATHPVFKKFVEENGLEFFNIGGDPAELMAFMVKNPGLMPGKDALRKGDIGRRRRGMYEIIRGCWRSCYEAGDGQGAAVSEAQLQEALDPSTRPFVADAIIANPPSFAHMHCAEKLGIPLHLMFTMPWSPTQSFPHPLANIQSSNADPSMTNFISFALVEMMTWQGLGDIINGFREKILGLEPISLMAAPGIATRMRIPYTYCWSPALIPKPMDWGSHISISGFYFLPLAANYEPEQELLDFLGTGPPPVYIGFGSIVVDDPNAMTRIIFEAVKKSGQRALVSKGWGGLGTDTLGKPEAVFMLGNVPHDWLFNHVSCVVHHGGAGTTAAGIAMGKPTVIVPFFGDQPFWGAMVAKAGAGPTPISSKALTSENLAAAIKKALEPSTSERAMELGARIAAEKGCDSGAKTFHDMLQVETLRCSLSPNRAAVWRVKRTDIRLSGFAATTLGNEGLLDFSDLRLYRPKEYDLDAGPLEPITGAASALVGTIGSLMMGIADVPVEIFKLRSRQAPDASGSKTAPSHELNTTSVPHDVANKSMSSLERPPQADRTEGDHDSHTEIRRSDVGNTAENIQGGQTVASASADSPPGQYGASGGISLDSAIGAGRGIGRIVDAGLKSPMDFTLSLAKGFRNAPKLYGDSSVRPQEPITGFQSGLRAAGKEFGYGFYDGISGLVTQPLEGAKREGFAGFLKGFGKGIGGVVLKPGAGIWGLPGYTFKGIYKELQKRLGSSVQNYIVAARTAQGYEDWNTSMETERLDVVSRWHAAQVDIHKQNRQWKMRVSPASERHEDQGKIQHRSVRFTRTPDVRSPESRGLAAGPSDSSRGNEMDSAFEDAIKESVLATSAGNPEEDKMIERAIRASIAELRQAPGSGVKDDTFYKAANLSGATSEDTASTHENNEENAQLEAALQLSSREYGSRNHQSEGNVERDGNIESAFVGSKPGNSNDSQDADLAQALAESAKDHESNQTMEERLRREDEIVLEYVKKQSQLEDSIAHTTSK